MEKIIVRGNVIDDGQRAIRCFLVPTIFFFMFVMIWVLNIGDTRKRYWGTGERETSFGEYFSDSTHLGDCFEGAWWGFFFWLTIISFIIGVIIYMALKKIEIVVSDKRVYGKTTFGKQVDLPVDSISSIGIGAFGRIEVATSSGVIEFYCIKNKTEIHKAIGELIMNRQKQNEISHESNTSDADELKKYKALFDDGVITQEEFDAKKKQLLGL